MLICIPVLVCSSETSMFAYLDRVRVPAKLYRKFYSDIPTFSWRWRVDALPICFHCCNIAFAWQQSVRRCTVLCDLEASGSDERVPLTVARHYYSNCQGRVAPDRAPPHNLTDLRSALLPVYTVLRCSQIYLYNSSCWDVFFAENWNNCLFTFIFSIISDTMKDVLSPAAVLIAPAYNSTAVWM